jgi:hypothetical protein
VVRGVRMDRVRRVRMYLTTIVADRRVWYGLLIVISIVFLVGTLRHVATHAPEAIAAAVIAASATVVVSVSGILATKHLEKRQEIEREQRERKLEVYQQFMDYYFAAMQKVRSEMNVAKQREFDRAFHASFPKNLISRGSEDIIKKYGAWVKLDDPEASGDIFGLENILLAMRKDLGYTNRGLKEGDLLRTFLEGVDERLAERNQR